MTHTAKLARRSFGVTAAAAVIPLVAAGTAAAGPLAQSGPHTSAGPAIVGGEPAQLSDDPSMVAINLQDNGLTCGGSLVAKNKVITAAHCVEDVGATELSIVANTANRSDPHAAQADVIDIWRNPKFSSATMRFDVAILTLDRNINAPVAQLNSDPALYPNTFFKGGHATVLGWGTVTSGADDIPETLRKVDVPLVDINKCRADYQDEVDPQTMVCAGLDQGGKDSCQGDSGGPMLIDGKLAGIVSWGDGCAQAGKPGVYTRVSSVFADVQKELAT